MLRTLLGSLALAVSLPFSVGATPLPSVVLPSRTYELPKTVFYPMHWSPDAWADAPCATGCLPYVVNGHGVYEEDTTRAGIQEGNYWIGGWQGPRMEWDAAKLAAALRTYPPGMLYVFDIEHWSYAKEDMEQTRRRLRQLLKDARAGNPLLRYAVYAIVPHNDVPASWSRDGKAKSGFATYSDFGLAYDAWRKWLRKEPLSDFPDRWALGGIAKMPVWNEYVLDKSQRFYAPFADLQSFHDAMGVGVQDSGRTVATQGVTDAVDVLCPSVYDHMEGNNSFYYLTMQTKEAKRLAKKPVYPFVSPQFVGPLAGKSQTEEEWRTFCKSAAEDVNCDGLLLWVGAGHVAPVYVTIAQEEMAKAASR